MIAIKKRQLYVIICSLLLENSLRKQESAAERNCVGYREGEIRRASHTYWRLERLY